MQLQIDCLEWVLEKIQVTIYSSNQIESTTF